ncbi:MAG: pilin [Candidatus Taylorbacteria bacterium]
MKKEKIIILGIVASVLFGGVVNGQTTKNTPTSVSGPVPTSTTTQSLGSLNILSPGTNSISDGVTPSAAAKLDQNLQFQNNGGLVNTPTKSPGSYTLLEPLPCIEALKNGAPGIECINGQVVDMNIKGYVQYMFNLLIAISAVAAVFMIVLGGFEYMTSDAIQGKSEGKEKIKHAIEGLLLVLCSYLILRTINPQFVNIPNTLVAPLTTQVKTGVLDFSTVLNDQANFAINNRNYAVTTLNNAKTTIANLSTQHNTISEQLMSNQNTDGTPLTASQRDTLILQNAEFQDQINQMKAVVVVNSGAQAFQTSVTYAAQGKTDMTLDANIANIDNIYKQDATSLVDGGLAAQPYTTADGYKTTAAQQLKDQASYAKGLLLIQQSQQIDSSNLGIKTIVGSTAAGAVTGATVAGAGGTFVVPVVGTAVGAGGGAVVGGGIGLASGLAVTAKGLYLSAENSSRYKDIVASIQDPKLQEELKSAAIKAGQ